jgi:glutamate N-acetyltransferase/amino-acid N-acetyltransferase
MHAVSCDLRGNGSGQLDLALIVSDSPATAAGVFTTNDVKAAPVLLCQRHLRASGTHRGILVNSGNANACTGPGGMADAELSLMTLSQQLGFSLESLFVCSTGRIGRALPMDKLLDGIERVVRDLGSTAEHASRAAEAILTSDTRPKTCTVRFEWQGKLVTVSGMAKGAGMIEPNMATMLAFITTDAEVAKPLLQEVLQQANQQSFNAITVDGDMSTNDTVLLLAGGLSGVRVTQALPQLLVAFQNAVSEVCQQLAQKIIHDGERVTKAVTLLVEGAQSDEAAQTVARKLGNSLLVKTSWFGSDPNWGRLLDAAGAARVGLCEDRLSLWYNDAPVLLRGQLQADYAPQWKAIVSEPAFTIRMDLGQGQGRANLLSTDLSTGYVDFNKSE